MPRCSSTRDFTPVLNAARLWIERAMVDDGSIFTDMPIWTLANAQAVHAAFVNRPDESDDKFLEKLQRLMSDAPAPAQQLMAEMLWITLLFPASDTIGGDTKRRQIRTIWNLSGALLPEEHPMLTDEVLEGIGSAGQGFNNYRWLELVFLVNLTIDLKKLDSKERARVFDEYDRYVEFVSSRTDDGKRQLRHILRFFAFGVVRVLPRCAPSESDSESEGHNFPCLPYYYPSKSRRKDTILLESSAIRLAARRHKTSWLQRFGHSALNSQLSTSVAAEPP